MEPLHQLKDAFYRCQFREVLRQTDAIADLSLQIRPEHLDLLMLRAGAFFERHRFADSRKIFERIALEPRDLPDDAVRYAKARLKYFEDDFLGAKDILLELLEGAQSREYEFKALLGLAHTLIELRQTQPLPSFSRALTAFEPIEKDDERIGLLTYLAKYHRGAGAPETAEKYLLQVLGIAGRRGWTYCIIHALFGLAEIALQSDNQERLGAHLEMMRGLLDATEARLLAYQINRRFSEHAPARVAIDFDPQTQRVLIHGQWLNLKDNPQVYQLLEVLHYVGSPVDDKELARSLWPKEAYAPQIHGRQITSLVEQARRLIEDVDVRPAILLGSEHRYQLASN